MSNKPSNAGYLIALYVEYDPWSEAHVVQANVLKLNGNNFIHKATHFVTNVIILDKWVALLSYAETSIEHQTWLVTDMWNSRINACVYSISKPQQMFESMEYDKMSLQLIKHKPQVLSGWMCKSCSAWKNFIEKQACAGIIYWF